MQVFTSVTSNYLPKARVLGWSLKRHHPEAAFHLVLSDAVPDWLASNPAPFDSIIQAEQLPIAGVRGWIFMHNLVELCTAVKGAATQWIMDRHPGEPVLYFDPDIVVLSRLDRLVEMLQRHDVILTPHQLEPDETVDAIMDNEMASLKHGVYNLGFLGVAPRAPARGFVDWWAERLRHFCQVNIPKGLFTDQRWIDLAHAFFDNIGVVRDPGCNVATWNLSRRRVEGVVPDGLRVNGNPLCFFHFSGFDSGAQEIMLDKYGGQSPVLYDLRDWYIGECARLGQEQYGDIPWSYACFDNGQPISEHHRRLYRERIDLQRAFPDPFSTAGGWRCYYSWYQHEYCGPVPRVSHPKLGQWASMFSPGRILHGLRSMRDRLGRRAA